MRFPLAVLCLLVAATRAETAEAISVRLVPGAPEVVVDDPFHIDVVADLDLPVLGWGLDVDPAGPVNPLGDPAIGPAWLPVEAPDGDGLAGVAFPDGIRGDGVLLATLRFVAYQPGSARFSASFTLNDPTEGFALDPSGFAPVFFDPVLVVPVTPVPEPAAALLLGAGLALLARRGARTAQRGTAPA
jgi:hypothetical protein